jgi:UDP-N-acetylmuramate--alanine ligase
VPGRHNRQNALAVLAASEGLGVEAEALIPGLAGFTGVGRRFEIVRDDAALAVVSDYAHHPTEIAVTIAAARDRFPDRRLLVLFQPHTFSRTKALLADFARALDQADDVILAEIYPAREVDTLGVSSASIAGLMDGPVSLAGTPDEAAGAARAALRHGDAVLVLGAGDIYQAAALIAQART